MRRPEDELAYDTQGETATADAPQYQPPEPGGSAYGGIVDAVVNTLSSLKGVPTGELGPLLDKHVVGVPFLQQGAESGRELATKFAEGVAQTKQNFLDALELLNQGYEPSHPEVIRKAFQIALGMLPIGAVGQTGPRGIPRVATVSNPGEHYLEFRYIHPNEPGLNQGVHYSNRGTPEEIRQQFGYYYTRGDLPRRIEEAHRGVGPDEFDLAPINAQSNYNMRFRIVREPLQPMPGPEVIPDNAVFQVGSGENRIYLPVGDMRQMGSWEALGGNAVARAWESGRPGVMRWAGNDNVPFRIYPVEQLPDGAFFQGQFHNAPQVHHPAEPLANPNLGAEGQVVGDIGHPNLQAPGQPGGHPAVDEIFNRVRSPEMEARTKFREQMEPNVNPLTPEQKVPGRELSPQGFYSHMEEYIPKMPEKMNKEQAMGLIEKSGTREPEIRATDIDKHLLGPEASELRRQLIDARETRSELIKRIKSGRPGEITEAEKEIDQHLADGLITREEALNKKRLQGFDMSKEQKLLQIDNKIKQIQDRQKELKQLFPNTENITRDDLLKYAQSKRTQFNEDVDIGTRTRHGDIGPRHSFSTPDAANPTMFARKLQVKTDAVNRIEAAKARIKEIETERSSMPVPNVNTQGLEGAEQLRQARGRLGAEESRLHSEIRQLTETLGPKGHFERGNVSWYIASMHQRTGDPEARILVPHQIQSDWQQALRKGRTSATHPIVADTSTNVDFMLRQVIKDAAEHNATHIAIPTGDTVRTYNPGHPEGMRGFYDRIVPRRLEKLLGEKGQRVDDLNSWNGTPMRGSRGSDHEYTIFPLSPENVLKARQGQRLYSVGPGVRLPGDNEED